MVKKNSFKYKKQQGGFTLLEIAIALTIIGILSFVLASSIKVVDDHDDFQANRIYMAEVKNALITFVQVNGYLPCPDTDGDGREETRSSNVCSDSRGQLPFQDLGIKGEDYWGNPFYYAVHDDADETTNAVVNPVNILTPTSYFNSSVARVFTYGTAPVGDNPSVAGFLKICADQASACSSSTSDADMLELAAIVTVTSFGKNGQATWAAINAGNTNGLSTKEAVNADGNGYFWQAQGSNVNGQEFDDQLIWLTGYDVKYAVVRAGNPLAW